MLSTLLKVLSTVNFSVHSLFLHTQHTSHLDWPHRKSLTNLFIEILEIEMEINNFLELRDASPNSQDRLTRGFRFAAQDWGCNTQQWAINLCPSESKLKKQSHYVCRHLLIKRNVGAAGQKSSQTVPRLTLCITLLRLIFPTLTLYMLKKISKKTPKIHKEAT